VTKGKDKRGDLFVLFVLMVESLDNLFAEIDQTENLCIDRND
jgi:hypothetical protein